MAHKPAVAASLCPFVAAGHDEVSAYFRGNKGIAPNRDVIPKKPKENNMPRCLRGCGLRAREPPKTSVFKGSLMLIAVAHGDLFATNCVKSPIIVVLMVFSTKKPSKPTSATGS
jgi:hypothetical protein